MYGIFSYIFLCIILYFSYFKLFILQNFLHSLFFLFFMVKFASNILIKIVIVGKNRGCSFKYPELWQQCHASLRLDQGICGFPTRLSHRAIPRATVVWVDPRLESRGSAGKTGFPGMDWDIWGTQGMVARPWSSSRLSCGEGFLLWCDRNAGNSFPNTQGKDPSSRARQRKRGSSGCRRDSRASSRVETGMSGNYLSCSKGVKDPLEVPEVRCD